MFLYYNSVFDVFSAEPVVCSEVLLYFDATICYSIIKRGEVEDVRAVDFDLSYLDEVLYSFESVVAAS